jgi:hypothetical protein
MKTVLSSLTSRFWMGVILITLVYVSLNVYITNYSLIDQTLIGSFSFNYKSQILSALFEGLFTAISHLSLSLLVIIGFLTGMNLMLIFRNKEQWVKLRSANFAVGFGTLFGTASGGCASCGLPLLGLLGISGSVGYLPFKGAEISIAAIGLLLVSLLVLLKQNAQACLLKK